VNRDNKILLIIIGFLIITVVVSSFTLAVKRNENDATEILLSQVETPLIIGEISIDGAVSFPGIFHFTDEDTIQSILTDAGVKPDASLNQIKIYIPYKEQKQSFQRIDINRAEKWLLLALPKIGESRAQAIVDYRSENGPFNCIEDILLINGFGEVTFSEIKELITVSE
jgi:competence protein ComEA